MLKTVSLNALLSNHEEHLVPTTLDSFIVFDTSNGHTRTFVTGKEPKSQWISLELAKEKAAELDCTLYVDKRGLEELRLRICDHTRETNIITSRVKLVKDAYLGSHGELRWSSNDTSVPCDFFESAMVVAPEYQSKSVDDDAARAIAEYLEGQANRTPEQIREKQADLRAAFGKGATVVDVISGESTRV